MPRARDGGALAVTARCTFPPLAEIARNDRAPGSVQERRSASHLQRGRTSMSSRHRIRRPGAPRARLRHCLAAGGLQMTASCASTSNSRSKYDASSAEVGPTGGLKLTHVAVVGLDNWSYDSLYGERAGTEGLA